MENSINIDVATLDAPHRRALEHVLGQKLKENQQLIISVMEVEVPPRDGQRPAQTLDEWTHIYDGLSDDEIEAIDKIAKTRATETVTEADILAKVVAPGRAGLTPEAARAFLAMRFDAPTTKKIRRFLQKNNRGTITAEERIALEKYLRVGQFLDLLQAKARLSLKQSAGDR